MSFDYTQYRETYQLRPMKVEGKEEYYRDIQELTDSSSPIVGKKYAIVFDMLAETERLLINAIALFEIGYFGFAFVLAPGRTLASAAAWGHAALPLTVLLAVELLVLAAMTRPMKVVIERAVMWSNLRVDLI